MIRTMKFLAMITVFGQIHPQMKLQQKTTVVISNSGIHNIATGNRRSPTEENELLKTALANSISTLKTLQSQLEESIKLSKKLKSKKTMLDFDLVKTTAKELHREVIEAVLTTEKSGIEAMSLH